MNDRIGQKPDKVDLGELKPAETFDLSLGIDVYDQIRKQRALEIAALGYPLTEYPCEARVKLIRSKEAL